ncbi:MAG: PH domain-containing protein [Symbiobacterium sp.]|uniref:PH domain-containing protein n=1 Tax=Symbiobacterium sp. TaxID=1971213 RepID=UPI003463C35C
MKETFYPPRPSSTAGSRTLSFTAIVALVVALIALGSSLLSAFNMQYEVRPEAIRVRSGLSTKEIPLDEVTNVWRPEKLSGGVRVFGTATSGLRTGRFRFNETGNITLYATQMDHLVVIDVGEDRYGLTPDDPEALMAAIADRATATFQPAGGRARATASMLVVVAVVLVAAGMAIYTLGLAGRFPQALRYELGPDGLTIRTGFRPVRVGYSEIERVEVASPKGYPARVYGTAIGSLFWGRFRWSAAGPNLYLYCTRLKPLVLLHLRSGRTIGLTPEEDERFVEALRQRLR